VRYLPLGIDANSVIPSALQFGERLAVADRTIIRTDIEGEVEAHVGTYVDAGVNYKYPLPAEE